MSVAILRACVNCIEQKSVKQNAQILFFVLATFSESWSKSLAEMWAFSSKIFPAQGVLFCPNFVPKGKLTMKKTFYWKVFKFFSKKQQTSMPDLFDWHVLILPENYQIITATKWLKQKNCKKDAGISPLCMYSFIIHSSIQCPSQQKNKE